MGKAAKGAKAPLDRDMPAGFLEGFAVQCGDRVFTLVDAAAGQLNLGGRFRLICQQNLPFAVQNCIDAGPAGIAAGGFWRLSVTSDHLTPWLPCMHSRGMPKMACQGNPMTIGTKLAWDDSVLPFQLDHSDIRGRVARLDGALQAVLKQHNYPPQVEALVAEATLLTALIGQTIKLRWKLSLQIRGNGPVSLIATDYFGPTDEGEIAQVRAYASFDAEKMAADAEPFSLIGEGYFAILIDQGPDMRPYQGITPISGGSLSACAETYFAQSEQLPTRFELSFGKVTMPGEEPSWRAGGVMLQHMPKASPAVAAEAGSGEGGLLAPVDILDGDEGENWTRVNYLLDTVEELELIGPHVAPTDLLVRLFHEEGPRVFDPQPVRFGCSCSEDRVRHSLSAYAQADLSDMITEEGILTADCQFCGAHYQLDPATIGIRPETETDDGAVGNDT
jgi:molecular chaperone Hsp33